MPEAGCTKKRPKEALPLLPGLFWSFSRIRIEAGKTLGHSMDASDPADTQEEGLSHLEADTRGAEASPPIINEWHLLIPRVK